MSITVDVDIIHKADPPLKREISTYYFILIICINHQKYTLIFHRCTSRQQFDARRKAQLSDSKIEKEISLTAMIASFKEKIVKTRRQAEGLDLVQR